MGRDEGKYNLYIQTRLGFSLEKKGYDFNIFSYIVFIQFIQFVNAFNMSITITNINHIPVKYFHCRGAHLFMDGVISHCHIIWLIWVASCLKSKCFFPLVVIRDRPQMLYSFGKLINRRKDLGRGILVPIFFQGQ